jgi:hypothetical protein
MRDSGSQNQEPAQSALVVSYRCPPPNAWELVEKGIHQARMGIAFPQGLKPCAENEGFLRTG